VRKTKKESGWCNVVPDSFSDDGLIIAAEADYRLKRQEIARLREALMRTDALLSLLRHRGGTVADLRDVNDVDQVIGRNRKLLGLPG